MKRKRVFCLFLLILAIPVFSKEPGVIFETENFKTGSTAENTVKTIYLNEGTVPKETGKARKFMFLAFGTLNFGMVTFYPCKPVTGDVAQYASAGGPNPAAPYDLSYGFGIGLDYRILKSLGIFFDGGFQTWHKLLAKKDGYGFGQWIWEQSDYTNAVVGPFPMDTYYYMDTTVMRLGARYIFSDGAFQLWTGGAVGLYAWQATIGNREEELKYGTPGSGLSAGYSLLAGIDFKADDFVFRVYADYGSAVASPKITDLFNTGWVFENTGGENIAAPFKVGLAVGFY